MYRHLEFNKVILLPTHGKTQGSSAYVIYVIAFLLSANSKLCVVFVWALVLRFL